MCKSHPGGNGFEGTKNSWGLGLWEAMEGHWWRYNFNCSWHFRTEGVMQGGWGLVPWREHMRGYWWSLDAMEDPSVLEMPPWDDHQEQLRQWSGSTWVLKRAELEKWSQPSGGSCSPFPIATHLCSNSWPSVYYPLPLSYLILPPLPFSHHLLTASQVPPTFYL